MATWPNYCDPEIKQSVIMKQELEGERERERGRERETERKKEWAKKKMCFSSLELLFPDTVLAMKSLYNVRIGTRGVK